MKIKPNERISVWALKQVRDRMNDRSDDPWHASEVLSCLRKSRLNREEPVEYDPTSIMMFAVGFALQEWFLGVEEESKLSPEGMLYSPDALRDGHILEFKSTRRPYYRKRDDYTFSLEDNDSWILRTGVYCALEGVNIAHVIVFFIYTSELHSFTVEFTDEELEDYRKTVKSRLRVLQRGELPSVKHRLGDWECERCPHFMKHCSKELKGKVNGGKKS